MTPLRSFIHQMTAGYDDSGDSGDNSDSYDNYDNNDSPAPDDTGDQSWEQTEDSLE